MTPINETIITSVFIKDVGTYTYVFWLSTAIQMGVPSIHGLFEWLCPATTEIMVAGPSHGNNCIIVSRCRHNGRFGSDKITKTPVSRKFISDFVLKIFVTGPDSAQWIHGKLFQTNILTLDCCVLLELLAI